MSELRYAQEYLGQFIDDLRRFFSDKLISAICSLKRGHSSRGEYFLGSDLARMGEDLSSFEILKRIDQDNIVQVDNQTTSKQLTTQTHDKILELNKEEPKAPQTQNEES